VERLPESGERAPGFEPGFRNTHNLAQFPDHFKPDFFTLGFRTDFNRIPVSGLSVHIQPSAPPCQRIRRNNNTPIKDMNQIFTPFHSGPNALQQQRRNSLFRFISGRAPQMKSVERGGGGHNVGRAYLPLFSDAPTPIERDTNAWQGLHCEQGFQSPPPSLSHSEQARSLRLSRTTTRLPTSTCTALYPAPTQRTSPPSFRFLLGRQVGRLS
jgi:hypothetical protein